MYLESWCYTSGAGVLHLGGWSSTSRRLAFYIWGLGVLHLRRPGVPNLGGSLFYISAAGVLHHGRDPAFHFWGACALPLAGWCSTSGGRVLYIWGAGVLYLGAGVTSRGTGVIHRGAGVLHLRSWCSTSRRLAFYIWGAGVLHLGISAKAPWR